MISVDVSTASCLTKPLPIGQVQKTPVPDYTSSNFGTLSRCEEDRPRHEPWVHSVGRTALRLGSESFDEGSGSRVDSVLEVR